MKKLVTKEELNDFLDFLDDKPQLKQEHVQPVAVEEQFRLLKVPGYDTLRMFSWQQTCAKEILEAFNTCKAQLLNAKAGYGKTFMGLYALDQMIKQGKLDGTACPYKAFWLSPASVVDQTLDVVEEFFPWLQEQVWFTNYEQLLTKAAALYVRWETVIIEGQEHLVPRWNDIVKPKMIVNDESQYLMRPSAQRTKLIDAGRFDYRLDISATPFSRLIEARSFVLASGRATPSTFIDWANDLAGQCKIDEFSEAAMERLMHELKGCVHRPRGVKPKYHDHYELEIIQFDSKEDAKEYLMAFIEYLKKLAEQGRSGPKGRNEVLAALTAYLKTAERLRAPYYARRAAEWIKQGYQVTLAARFKCTIAKFAWHLINDHGLTRDDISLIWGGITEDLKEEYQGLSLGAQDRYERRKEKNKFQSGRASVCAFTFAAGGAGLSLHHDRPETKPRRSLCTPPYSDKQLVQAFGRSHRITSLSDTKQYCCLYEGTEEESSVLPRLKTKLKSLNKVVGGKESWITMLSAAGLKLLGQDLSGIEVPDDDDSNAEGFAND